jgi:uncharacterized protein YgiM (DUF1202 family)
MLRQRRQKLFGFNTMSHLEFARRSSIRFALPLAMWACAVAGNATAESPPYEARVIVSGAQVQSGPGDNYYATDNLNQGDAVEVYREKPGGWLAIRPPEGSFSWIAARDLILKDSTIAEVAKDDVASRIGSRLNDRHNAAQVRLKKGEAVEILGDEMINGERWYKISPPAGEFRWIQSSLVERTGPIQKGEPSPLSVAADGADPHPVKQASATGPVTSATNVTTDSGAPPLLPVTKPTDPATLATASKPPTTTATANPTSTATPPAQPAQTQPPQAGPVSATPQPATTQPTGDLNHDLSAIELRLSRMVAAPTNLWNTARLERDTAALMARAKTQPEREAVRATQEKINRFAEIGRRANQNSAWVPGQQPTRLPSTAAVASSSPGGPYDAEGILRPVVSRRPGAPQFALVDERGQVVSFVTATPDLNLQPYLGRRIGVVGNRGYIPEFQRNNVTAARVTPLNDRMVR